MAGIPESAHNRKKVENIFGTPSKSPLLKVLKLKEIRFTEMKIKLYTAAKKNMDKRKKSYSVSE